MSLPNQKVSHRGHFEVSGDGDQTMWSDNLGVPSHANGKDCARDNLPPIPGSQAWLRERPGRPADAPTQGANDDPFEGATGLHPPSHKHAEAARRKQQ